LAIAALPDTLQRIGDDRIDSVILEPILPPTSNHAHVQDTGSQYNDVEGGDGTAHNLEGALHNGTLDTGGLRRSIRLSLLIVVCILPVSSSFDILSIFVETLVTQELAFAVQRKCQSLTTGQKALNE
jgi:hypothetical protein